MSTKVKIDFMVPGFSKCGTTTLCALLDLHPDIYIPPIKEPWYFSHKNFETQHESFDSHYAAASEGQLKCDGSTDYTGYLCEQVAAQRIFENNPDCRFIFIARNPAARIESSYREMHHSGVTFGLNAPYSLSENLKLFPQMVQDTLYWERIATYRKTFGDDAILVVFLEDLKSDWQQTLSECLAHIGLDSARFPAGHSVSLNTGEQKLYDSRLLRLLRTTQFTGLPLAKLEPARQDAIFVPLRLRRSFGKKTLKWDQYSLNVFREKIAPDSVKFLEFYGKTASFWGLEIPE